MDVVLLLITAQSVVYTVIIIIAQFFSDPYTTKHPV